MSFQDETGQTSEFLAGDFLFSSADTNRSTTSSTFVKVKEIQIFKGGTLRIAFTGGVDSAARDFEGYIARNDVQVGILRSTNDPAGTTWTEDISGWTAGDLVQIYHRRATGATGFAETRNFRIFVDSLEIATVIVD